MSCGVGVIRRVGVLAIPLCAATLVAQYALDENLQVGGGRVNPASGYAMPLGRDIYRVNRATGDFQYVQGEAYRWGPQAYNVRAQDYLMRTGVMDTYSRPVETMGSNSSVYNQNWRTGAYRFNQPNALARGRYDVYQSAAPPSAPHKPIEIGESTPVYRPVRRPMGGYAQSATIDASAPMSNQLPRARPPQSTGSVTNLTPQVYRPPFVRIPPDAE